MKIYTKGGDTGKTSLLGGDRKDKSDIRIHAYGTIDELNAYMGLLGDQPVNQSRVAMLREIQNVLFTIGSYLAADPGLDRSRLPKPETDATGTLELSIDEMTGNLPELRSFTLPGGHQSVSFCHIARCVCRRAERWVVTLNQQEVVEPWILVFLNRLSDYLFVLGRQMGHELQVEEIPWKPKK